MKISTKRLFGEHHYSLDSALFLEVSEKPRTLWAAQPALYQHRMTQCSHISKALVLRELWLGVSQTDSVEVLCSLGWNPLDVMLAYLGSEISDYSDAINPDCAVAAARVRFDRVWNGPEYNGDDMTVLGTEFYRMDPIPFGDRIPSRAVASQESLPPRFTAAASAAFRQLADLK